MFNVNRFLRPQKFIIEQNFKNYLIDSVNKYDKLTIEINEDDKRKKAMNNILYENENKNAVIKSTNHSVNDLINNSKIYRFFFIFSFISIGALICYKRK